MISNRLRELLGVVYVLKQYRPDLKMCPDFLAGSAQAAPLRERHTPGTVSGDLRQAAEQQPPLFTREQHQKKTKRGGGHSSFNILYSLTPEGEAIGQDAARSFGESEMAEMVNAYFDD
jgi:hypothetical protein